MAVYGQSIYGTGIYGPVSDAGPPAFRAQVPAPDATSVADNTTVYAEVVQVGATLDEASVKLYINSTLAWSGSRAMPGFTITRSVVSDGYSYLIRPAGAFEQGVQVVRGTASNAGGDDMDESYTFSTVRQLVTPGDIAALVGQVAGLDLLLTTTDNDISVDGADLRLVAGADEVAQHIGLGLRMGRGEWYLDSLAGVPYYKSFFVNNPNSSIIETILRREILGDDDIEALTELSLEIDRLTRRIDVEFSAVSVFGDIDAEAVFP